MYRQSASLLLNAGRALAARAPAASRRQPVRSMSFFTGPNAEYDAHPLPWYKRTEVDDYDAYSTELPAEHRREREALMREVHSMLESSPRVQPDQAFYERVLNMYMRQDDRNAVRTVRDLAAEGGVELKADFLKKVNDYVADAHRRSYQQGSGW
eukprot:m.180782 g.180782  ORF g.180782 m.180782 type:complete len:154 (-) comp17434_c2_seq3:2826-3287(-)